MGSNPTQAVGIALFLIAFVMLAGALAGGGILLVLGFVVFLGVAIALFMKVRPLEHQKE